MSERPIGRREFILGTGALALGTALGKGDTERMSEQDYIEILIQTQTVDALIHNAERLADYDRRPNSAHFLEIDILSLDGRPAIGHSDSEIVSIPEKAGEIAETFSRIRENGSNIHVDLKSPDIDVARDIYGILPPDSFVSTPHHEVLDELRALDGNARLLYTINSQSKKRDFARRIASGESFENCGVSIHYSYLSGEPDVRAYQDSNLYVLAYSANRLDLAAALCSYGVNGITSDREDILGFIAQR